MFSSIIMKLLQNFIHFYRISRLRKISKSFLPYIIKKNGLYDDQQEAELQLDSTLQADHYISP